jgi:hypothetical protein
MLMCRIMPDGQVPYWTGTHGEMISSDPHGVEEPTRWMLRPHQRATIGQRWSEALNRRRGGRSTKGTLAELDLRGLCLLHWNIDPRMPRMSPMMIMMSSILVDVLGGRFGSVGTCGRLEKPKKG